MVDEQHSLTHYDVLFNRSIRYDCARTAVIHVIQTGPPELHDLYLLCINLEFGFASWYFLSLSFKLPAVLDVP